MKRAILYARVSTWDKQRPEVQLEQLRAVAKQRGWKVISEITERLSGAKDKRPGLDQAMLILAAAGADVLAATALDRVGRSLRHVLNVHASLEAWGCTMVLLRENVDTSTPMGRFAFQIMGAAGELERELIRERVRAGLQYAREQGRIGGRRRTLPERVVEMAANMRSRNPHPTMSWSDICRTLKAHGHGQHSAGAVSRAVGRYFASAS